MKTPLWCGCTDGAPMSGEGAAAALMLCEGASQTPLGLVLPMVEPQCDLGSIFSTSLPHRYPLAHTPRIGVFPLWPPRGYPVVTLAPHRLATHLVAGTACPPCFVPVTPRPSLALALAHAPPGPLTSLALTHAPPACPATSLAYT